MGYEHFCCSYVRGAKSDYDRVFTVIDCVDFLPKLVFICRQQKLITALQTASCGYVQREAEFYRMVAESPNPI